MLQAYPLTPNLSAKTFIKFVFQSIISAIPAIREVSIWVVKATLKSHGVGYMRRGNSKLSDIISEDSSVKGTSLFLDSTARRNVHNNLYEKQDYLFYTIIV
jgi:hypothetical protein